MKKFLSLFASLCLALIMVVSLVGCGNGEEESSGNDVDLEQNNSENEDDSKDDSSGKLLGSGKMFASVQAYIDAQQDQIDAAIKQNMGSGMSMEVKADGDALVYRYVYDEAVEVTDYVIDTFDSNLDTYKPQFEAILEEMERLVDGDDPEVRILYENPDGSLVYSCSFTKDGVKTTPGEVVKGGADSPDGGKMFATVQEYLDAQKDQIDAAVKQIEGSGMSMEITADGDTLIYRYVYDVEVPIGDETTASFEASLDLYESQFGSVLDEMERLIDVKEPAVKVSYENQDGSVVYTHTFTK
ncbi:MAG: DUF4854 domain-containing protein [Lachnospiraceae bacterium]|nr:DUF4854 domain-containing protein [Lachnospiraceae bacterium]